jgi:hypothetical protein
VVERNYPVTLLFGGARSSLDFEGLVGGAHGITINFKTARELEDAGLPVRSSIDEPVEPAVEARLAEAFEDFRRAMTLGSLGPDEFADFGPVRYFRGLFVAGWDAVLERIGSCRSAAAVGSRPSA